MEPTFLEAFHRQLIGEARAKAKGLNPDVERSDEALRDQVAALGLYDVLVPKEFGGRFAKVDVRAICAVREELAYQDSAADSLFAVQGLGSHPILLGGSAEQKQLHLPRVSRGEALFAFALTEENAGSDVAALETRAERTPAGYTLNGKKKFISNAGVASHYTVFARTSDGPKGLSCFLVPHDTLGFRVSAKMKLMGDHPIGELALENCCLPEDALVGQEGQGMRLALGTLDVFRATVGAAAVGMSRRALAEAVVYAKERKQFGHPLAELQGIQFLLAESATELEASRLLVHKAAATKDLGKERVGYEAGMAKLFATEAAQRIVDRCLQVHGGNGVVKGFAVERLYRDVRALRIYEGASEVQKVVIARHLLGSP